MLMRCPTSRFQGVGRLLGYRWIINDRGYANVVSSPNTENVVYGLIYSLTPSDERTLDRNEGVPWAYTKETLAVDFWSSKGDSGPVNVMREPDRRDMVLYIDRLRLESYRPKDEYIHRMNMGIEDGIRQGIPLDYVGVLREYIPAKARRGVEELARQQALSFEDET